MCLDEQLESSSLECIFEILLLMAYKELSRTFGQLERLNLGGLNQVCKCIKKNPNIFDLYIFSGFIQ